jgi:hypothetical protein
MLRLQKINLRSICRFFRMNSGGMEDTTQFFLCKNGSRGRPTSARNGNLKNINYEIQVLNMVEEIVQDSQQKGNRHAAMLQQQPTSLQHCSQSWTATAQGEKVPSHIEGRLVRKTIQSLEGISRHTPTRHCNTMIVEKCVCGRVDNAAMFGRQQTPSTLPIKNEGMRRNVSRSLHKQVHDGNLG